MANDQKSRTRKDFFGPILLIVIGLVFLAHNIGILPGEGWGSIFRLWPLLLVVAGLNDLLRGEGIIWPILLIGAGSFLLLNNLGPREYVSWSNLLRLWPILLIAGGIDLIFKNRTVWTTLFGLALVVALIGGGYLVVTQTDLRDQNGVKLDQELTADIEQAEVTLSLGSGQISIAEIRQGDHFLTGMITTDQADETIVEEKNEVIYNLSFDQPSVYPSGNQWDLQLTDRIPIGLNVEQGAGEFFLAGEALQLQSANIDQGVGRLMIRIPEQGGGEMIINQAIGEISIILPTDLNVELQINKGLSVVDYPRGLSDQQGILTSSGSDSGGDPFRIYIEQAIGRISLQYAR